MKPRKKTTTMSLRYKWKNTNLIFLWFICNADSLFCPSSFIAASTTLYWQCVRVSVCATMCVWVCTWGGLFACLLFAPLFLADRDSLAPLSPPVTMTEREQVRGKNCTICLQRGVDTQRERALQTLTPLTTSVPPPLPSSQRSERTQWNSNHKHNPSRTSRRHTRRSPEMATFIKTTEGWPSKCHTEI